MLKLRIYLQFYTEKFCLSKPMIMHDNLNSIVSSRIDINRNFFNIDCLKFYQEKIRMEKMFCCVC